MTLQQKIDEMYRQYMTTKSDMKRKELMRAIRRAENERRRLKRGSEIVE